MKFGLYARKSSEDSSKQVQSIENQIQVLKDKAAKDGLNIVKVYQESKSAKKPYKREKFIQLVQDLQDGVIDGIICWKLDRLSRNPIDGGMIQHLLLEETVQQIVTYEKTYYPSDNSIMMSVELGMATEYSQALSKNVKRGQSFKAVKGHYPNTAPLGYLNSTHLTKGERVILLDEDRAPLIRKLWEMLLSGQYSSGEILKNAHAIGLRTRATRSKPEAKLSRHGLYCIFKNPFYYGQFQWGRRLHDGLHQPLITKDEFDRAQLILAGKQTQPRLARHEFPFKGFIRCGECGASITGEQKNKHRKDGSINLRTYYRCTHHKANIECHQPSIRAEELELQIKTLLDSITITDDFLQWGVKHAKELSKEAETKYESVKAQQRKRTDQIDQEINRLLELTIQDAIDTNTFKLKKASLIEEKKLIETEISLGTEGQDYRMNKTIEVFEYCRDAKTKFETGNYTMKKQILQTLGSRLFLKDRKLSVELTHSFKLVQDSVSAGWILSPRFATLKTQTAPGLTDADYLLLSNGGDEGT